MSIRSNIPQIAALKSAIEKTAGCPICTHNAFIALVENIENTLREHLSESTLERLWGYSTRETKALSTRTLDVLSRYVGADSWEDFCQRIKAQSPSESEELIGAAIRTDEQKPGTVLKIGWLPDRIIRVRYIGENEWELIEAINSHLCEGDKFKCLLFQKGQPLYLDCFIRAGETKPHRYVAGERNGITLLEIE